MILTQTSNFENNVKSYYFQKEEYTSNQKYANLLLGSISLEYRFRLPDYHVETLKVLSKNGTLQELDFYIHVVPISNYLFLTQ